NLPQRAQRHRKERKAHAFYDIYLISCATLWKCGTTYLTAVIGRFFSNNYIVRMAFGHARGGDADKLRVVLQNCYSFSSGITHARPQTANELLYDLTNQSFVWHTAYDAFGNEFFYVGLHVLEIPV